MAIGKMERPCALREDARYLQATLHLSRITETSPEVSQQVQADLHRFIGELRQEEQVCTTSTMHERHKIDQRIANFAYEKSIAWAEIRRRHWDQLTQAELLSVAQLLGWKAGIPLDREAKRRKRILVKWFDENLGALRPYIDCVRLDFAEEEQGEGDRQAGAGRH
jgi:hypothetical protein